MISTAEYRRLTNEQVKGRRVRLRFPIETRQMKIPAGTVLTVTEKRAGYWLEHEPCVSCGVVVKVIKVKPHLLDWVTVPYPQECMCEGYPDHVALDCHVHNGAPLHFDTVCAQVPDEVFVRPSINEDHPCHCP